MIVADLTAAAPVVDSEIAKGAGIDTDLSNAIRLVHHHAADLRFCRGIGWLAWDGRRWAPDRGAAERVAAHLPAYVLREAAEYLTLASMATEEEGREKLKGKAKALQGWAKQSGMAPRLAAALAVAAAQLEVKVGELDRDPWALNVLNGTLDLRVGELRRHRREDFITKLCPVEFDPAAAAPQFEALVRWAMLDRDPLVSYLKRAAGYSAVGSNREQALLFAYGSGANGKSTIIEAILGTLGDDYAVHAMPDLLTAAQGERHATELAHLRGARMVVCSETEDGRRLAVQRMKQLTGEGRITARAMRQDPISFEVHATLWLQSNHRPQVTEQTRAVWRRIRVIPFEATVEREDKELGKKLLAERRGILRWIVEGAVEWYRDGLGMPPEVEAAVNDYRAASDTLGTFIAACCATGESLVEGAGALHTAYVEFCRSEGTAPLDAAKFKVAMAERGLISRAGKGNYKFFHGVALTGGDADA